MVASSAVHSCWNSSNSIRPLWSLSYLASCAAACAEVIFSPTVSSALRSSLWSSSPLWRPAVHREVAPPPGSQRTRGCAARTSRLSATRRGWRSSATLRTDASAGTARRARPWSGSGSGSGLESVSVSEPQG
eukprot:scaffold15092_cov58-Phaeocystis_antarctica.AAC.3